MSLHSNNNINRIDFPRIQSARRGPALLLMAGVALVLLTSNCRNSSETENREPKTMNNTSENTTAANDPLAIHRRAIIVDMHADTTQRLVDEKVDLEQRLSDGHLDAVRAKEGGLDAQFFSIWVEPELFGGGERAMKRADVQIQAIHDLAEKHP